MKVWSGCASTEGSRKEEFFPPLPASSGFQQSLMFPGSTSHDIFPVCLYPRFPLLLRTPVVQDLGSTLILSDLILT